MKSLLQDIYNVCDSPKSSTAATPLPSSFSNEIFQINNPSTTVSVSLSVSLATSTAGTATPLTGVGVEAGVGDVATETPKTVAKEPSPSPVVVTPIVKKTLFNLDSPTVAAFPAYLNCRFDQDDHESELAGCNNSAGADCTDHYQHTRRRKTARHCSTTSQCVAGGRERGDSRSSLNDDERMASSGLIGSPGRQHSFPCDEHDNSTSQLINEKIENIIVAVQQFERAIRVNSQKRRRAGNTVKEEDEFSVGATRRQIDNHAAHDEVNDEPADSSSPERAHHHRVRKKRKSKGHLDSVERLQHARRCSNDPNRNKTLVEIRVVFLKIGEIDTLKELYHADAFIQVRWREPSLDGKNNEELINIDVSEYWNPLIYIDNILSESKNDQWTMAQSNEAREVHIIEKRRIKGVFLETLELNDFPLDVQDLTITLTSERPDTEVDIIPDTREMSLINIQNLLDQQEWSLYEHVEITKRLIRQEYSSSMHNHACLSVTCRAARRPGYFYWNVFLIMFMISSLSFATFSVTPDKPEYRLRLSFTLVLTSVTFKYVITQSLPKISYLTYMDKYVLMSLAILCIVSVWHAAVPFISPLYSSEANDPLTNAKATLEPHSPGLTTPETAATHAHVAAKKSINIKQNNQQSRQQFVRATEAATAATVNPRKQPNRQPVIYHHRQHQMTRAPQPSLSFQSPSHQQQDAAEIQLHIKLRMERDIFITFTILYFVAHFIFFFWLYADASKRRREMKKKDKDYKEIKKNSALQKLV